MKATSPGTLLATVWLNVLTTFYAMRSQIIGRMNNIKYNESFFASECHALSIAVSHVRHRPSFPFLNHLQHNLIGFQPICSSIRTLRPIIAYSLPIHTITMIKSTSQNGCRHPFESVDMCPIMCRSFFQKNTLLSLASVAYTPVS